MIIPNSTQVPNYIIDEIMPQLSGASFRVLMIIIRQTLGWVEDKKTGKRKEKDWISYTKLQDKTGLHRESVSLALKDLEDKELIEIFDYKGNIVKFGENIGKPKFYRLKTVSENPTGSEEGGRKNRPTGRKIEHTKVTITKGTGNTNVLPDGSDFLSVSVDGSQGLPESSHATSYSKKETYSELIRYMAGKLKAKFPNYGKQMKYIKLLLDAGNTPDDIKGMIDACFKDAFWHDKSPDFATIYNHAQRFVEKEKTEQEKEYDEFDSIIIKELDEDPSWKETANSWEPEKRARFRKYRFNRLLSV